MPSVAEATAIATDATFGPQFASRFDFTILFENTILTILPTALIIVASVFHVLYYWKQTTRFGLSLLLWVKLLAACAIIALEVAKSAAWKLCPDYQSPSSTAASILSCVAALCVTVMLVLEHRKAFQSSVLLSIYFTLVTIADVIKSRSFLMRPGLHVLGALCAATAVLKFILVVLLEVPKNVTTTSEKTYNQESTGGFWNRTLAVWVNSTLFLGFRNALSLENLVPLGPQFESQHLSVEFQPLWDRADKTKDNALLFTSIRALRWAFFYPIIPRLCMTVFSFSTPPIMRGVLDFVNSLSDPTKNPMSQSKSGLTIAFAIAYLGLGISKASDMHLNNRYTTLLRGQLVSTIIKKDMRLLQDQSQRSASLSLMSADVDGILLNIIQFHNVWISVVEVGLALYFLYTNVGVACFLPIITITMSVVVTHFITKRMQPATKDWNAAIQKRVSKTTSVLTNIKAVKMLGLETIITRLLQGLREQEVQKSIVARKIEVVKVACLPLISAFTPLVTIAGALYWTTLSHGLKAAEVFVLIAYLFLIYSPMIFMFHGVPTLGSVVACYKRIQEFLLLEEHADPRTVWNFEDKKPEVLDEKHTKEDHASTETLPCLAFVNARVGYPGSDTVVLQDMNLEVMCGSLIMVVGPVASGKSTLLKSILGETGLLDGQIRYDGSSIAYADQKPWLPNTTVRHTIVGECKFDNEWYSTVVNACALEHDITSLRKGDETVVGSNGAALSGGQKQRLSLARAVYSRAPIVVLDDILSALDTATASHIVTHLFASDGLLKTQNRTTIIATHAVEYRSVADQVMVLDKQGNVMAETGEARLHDLGFAPVKRDEVNKGAEDKPAALPVQVARLRENMALSSAQMKRTGDAKLYSYFLQFVPKRHLIWFLILRVMSSFIERSPQLYVRIWVDVAPHSKLWLVGLGVIAVLAVFFNYTSSQSYLIVIIPIIAESLHEMFLKSAVGSTLSHLTSLGIGPLINRTSQDMTLLGQDLPLAFYRFIYILSIVIVDTGVIAAGARYAGLMIPVIFAILYVIQMFYLRTSRQMRHLDLEAKTPLFTQVHETAMGLQHIRSFGWEKTVLKETLHLLDESQKPYYYLLSLQRWLTLVLDMITTTVGTIIVVIATNWPATTTQPSLGLSLVSVFAYSLALMALVERWTLLEMSLGAVTRLRDFVQDTPTEKDGPNVAEQPMEWPQTGHIQLKSLSCHYKHDGEAHTALEYVSVDIKAGQKVVIRGRTGSGKSSLVLSLLNLVDHTGEILIDGVNINDVPRAQLRRVITTIPQEVPELPGTVLDNLFPLEMLEFTDEQMKKYKEQGEAMLEKVELWKHVDANGGIMAPFDDMSFSTGQKQLFSLARAMLHQENHETKIVLMDEVTSNLDAETEMTAQQIMRTAFGRCTRLIISHRPTVVEECDVDLQLANGRVVDDGEKSGQGSSTDASTA